ncbi:hypothetical protein [Lacibacter sp.]|uniref:hypothetical protein n=1 Tax=Lacibacter sp. TaxID=1915409 RepID=UPI002B4B7664|nr:hypothetical protein [Lacibacter sp.]HLP37746.1 hypothetical protein [Lacibacter sp.]
MKFHYLIIVIMPISFLHYSCSTSHYYDGEYVFTDSSTKPALVESIAVKGSTAILRMRSLFSKSKLKKSSYICFQHPGVIDLYMGKREPPISIPVDKDGNLVWDNKLFKKPHIPVIRSNPIPEAFMESEKIK